MNEYTENPVFASLIKLNNVTNVPENKPTGWYVRERVDATTGKGLSLELGAYLNDSIFISVPVHYTMKNKFIKVNTKDTEFNYYAVPNDVQFAVAKYTSKRTNLENAMLVNPSEKNPAVIIAAVAHSSKMAIINCEFANENTKVLRKYFDKDRTFVGFIAFNEPTENSPSANTSIKCVIKEGIPGSKTIYTKTLEFSFNGHTSDDDTVPSEQPVATEFIKMPMYIELPPKDKKNENSLTDKNTYEKPKYNNSRPNNNHRNDNYQDKDSDEKPKFQKKFTNNKPKFNGGEFANKPNRYQNKKNFKNRNSDN